MNTGKKGISQRLCPKIILLSFEFVIFHYLQFVIKRKHFWFLAVKETETFSVQHNCTNSQNNPRKHYIITYANID